MSTTELIDLIKPLPDDKKKEVENLVEDLLAKVHLENYQNSNTATKPGFGGGKGIIAYMADDFDEPMEEFKDYM